VTRFYRVDILTIRCLNQFLTVEILTGEILPIRCFVPEIKLNDTLSLKLEKNKKKILKYQSIGRLSARF